MRRALLTPRQDHAVVELTLPILDLVQLYLVRQRQQNNPACAGGKTILVRFLVLQLQVARIVTGSVEFYLPVPVFY